MALKVYFDTDTNMCHVQGTDYSPGDVRLRGDSSNVILEINGVRVVDQLPVSELTNKNGVAYSTYTAFRTAIKDFFVKAPGFDAGAILYGVERLRNSPDPDFYPIGNPYQHITLPIHQKRLIGKVNFARQIVGIFNQTNINFMQDGSPAVLDGSDNTDIVAINPTCYAILDGGGTAGEFERWILGDRPFTYDGDVAVLLNQNVVSADYATLETPSNRLRCVLNNTAAFAGTGAGATAGGLEYPRTNISRYNMEIFAGNRGTKWYGKYFRDHQFLRALMYIEFKTKNLKAIFGAMGTGWGGTQWNDYNGSCPVVKILETHLALSGRADVVSQGHLTGAFSKTFNFMSGGNAVSYTTPFGVYRGEILRSGLWSHMSGIEFEIQSVADGGLSRVWVQNNPDLLDANRSDASFAFKGTYTYIGNAARNEGFSRRWMKGGMGAQLAGSPAGETTYDCMHFWTNIPGSGTARRCVLEGGPLTHGGGVAVGSSITNFAPSLASSTIGVGFRADVAE